jgi:CheY-like chemotaxis protein
MNQGKQLILIVDDTTADIKILADLLHPEYGTLFAKDGQRGLELARRHNADLILLDIMMPELDGYEVYRRLRQDPATADTPVMFVTALGGEEFEREGLELGAVDYITKPFNPGVVRARVRNQLALHQMLKLREDVERMTHHDIKNPVGAILNLSDMLLGEPSIPAEAKDALRIIRTAGFRVLSILNNSLNMYAMETGAYRATPEPVDLAQTLRAIVREFRGPSAFSLRLEERELADEDVFLALAEPLLCHTLFANLLGNAAEAALQGETISVRLSQAQDDKVRIDIHNQAPVPESIREKFFGKYVTAGKTKGTGLGAYIALLIARTLGGDATMQSSEDEGTTLSVTLPSARNGRR